MSVHDVRRCVAPALVRHHRVPRNYPDPCGGARRADAGPEAMTPWSQHRRTSLLDDDQERRGAGRALSCTCTKRPRELQTSFHGIAKIGVQSAIPCNWCRSAAGTGAVVRDQPVVRAEIVASRTRLPHLRSVRTEHERGERCCHGQATDAQAATQERATRAWSHFCPGVDEAVLSLLETTAVSPTTRLLDRMANQ
jgi:hypothetical protein